MKTILIIVMKTIIHSNNKNKNNKNHLHNIQEQVHRKIKESNKMIHQPTIEIVQIPLRLLVLDMVIYLMYFGG